MVTTGLVSKPMREWAGMTSSSMRTDACRNFNDMCIIFICRIRQRAYLSRISQLYLDSTELYLIFDLANSDLFARSLRLQKL